MKRRQRIEKEFLILGEGLLGCSSPTYYKPAICARETAAFGSPKRVLSLVIPQLLTLSSVNPPCFRETVFLLFFILPSLL
ncbi:hypothetical protein L873DRAFT_1807405 [Choiromyces venosus 120613-1]|uniref:Uncharacterized protein n=1 Tax=Choiromyces venosus 120613-1 TaxID=1336337 RepID=A0A3N4JPP6_9PEZI|nr:hypothetical protein L873DRAFT_1824617 [Choiromyces venosus 120613-1]RPA89319.1 hypothetical protein L873DRAFT_1823081 [Choiromyces venosus 120613-1]RPA98988.1 hypothetical protein L873DRAFT_1807405 [Choiromyces venosus 120613-1]